MTEICGLNKAYIVTVNNPYYSTVLYFDTLEKAQKRRDGILEEHKAGDGRYKCFVTLAKVIETLPLRTEY